MNTPIHDEHATVWPLLPWLAGGQLDAADEAAVADHVRTCPACRAELAWQRRLHAAAAMAPEPPLPDMDAALARLLPQLDEPAPASRPARPARPPLLGMLADWLGRAPRIPLVPAVFALLLVALTVSQPPATDDGYRGLGPVPEAGADTAVVFHPGTAEADIRRILAAAGAASVHGPTDAGAWVLAIGRARQEEALARLRADPAVLMAEPLAAPEGR